jgi:hypothetical protein
VRLRLRDLQGLVGLRHGTSVRARSPIRNPRRRQRFPFWRCIHPSLLNTMIASLASLNL